MKKNYKIILIFVSLIFLSTGCSATYYAEITNKSITENISLVETSRKTYENAYLDTYGTLDDFSEGRTYLKTYLDKKIENTINKYYVNKDNFYRDNNVRTNQMYNTEYRYSIKNDSKELPLKNNFFINNVIKDSIIVNDNNIILHVDNIPNGLLDEIDDVTITIYTELNVTSNNADTVENNSYTWKLNKNNYKTKALSMYIERQKNEQNAEDNTKKENSKTKKDSTALHIVLVIGIYIAIIIFVVNLFNKKKKLF